MINFKKKFLIFPIAMISSVAVISTSISCNKNVTEYLVTLHPGNGHTINGKDTYSYKVQNKVELEPTPDSKEGYTFSGWYKNKELTGDVVTFPLNVNENVDLYADYITPKETYKISFNSDGGSDVPTYYVNFGDEIKTAPITTKKDNNFDSWVYEDGSKVSFPLSPTRNLVLKATWIPIERGYLTLHTNGGTQPDNFEKVEGQEDTYKSKESLESLLVSPTTTKSGFDLKGWYTSEKLEDESRVKDFPYAITKDTDLYAGWVSNTIGHNLYLFDDDKATSLGSVLGTSYVAYSPTPSISKEHKTFVGWTDENGNSISFPLQLNDNKNIYAKWEDNKQCTITFKDYDDSIITTNANYDKGSIINSPFDYNGKYKDYGTFNGWKDTNGDLITYPFTIPEDDELTLKADVTINSAIINIYNSEEPTKVIKSLGNIKTLASQPEIVILERLNDYKLSYLCTDNSKQSTSEISYPFDVSNKTSLIDENHEIKLYAVWDQDERYYNITLNYGDGVTPSRHIMEHQKGSIKPSQFTKATATDKVISGWKDENGTLVDNDTGITLNKDRTFTAIWKYTHRNLTVVRYDGSSDTYEHLPVSYKLSDVPQVSRKYYTLKGFTIDGEAGSPVHPLTDSITLKDDNTSKITESWSQTSSKLTVVYKDESKGIEIADRVIDGISTTFNTNTIPTETYIDYEITGYKYKDVTYNLGEEIKLDTDTTDATITAVWKKNAFKVTFDYNDGSGKTYVMEHVSKLTSDNIPTLTKSGKRLVGYSETSTGEVISLVDKTITENKTYFAKWVDAGTKFTVTFNLGSLQALAKFSDTTITGRTTSIEGTSELYYDNCPKVECKGCSFLGWFISENETTTPVYPLTTTQTLYARFAPLDGYVSLCLNVTNGGVFKDTQSSSMLITVKKGETKWADIKASIPEITFGDAFIVSSWKDSSGNAIGDTATFSTSTDLFSVITEDVKDPSSFATDNWPTFCKVAENDDVTDENGANYDSGIAALKGKYKTEYEATSFKFGDKTYTKSANTFVGLLRTLKYLNVDYTVRVVGQEQDVNSSTNSNIPLTFEFVDLISIETIDNARFTNSVLYPKLNIKGTIYSGLQYSLIYGGHITAANKVYTYYSSGSSKTETKDSYLFLPSLYEINITSETSYTSILYTYYESCTEAKRIKNYKSSAISYWVRSAVSDGPAYIEKDGNKAKYGSSIPVGRGIAPMFCIGK